MRLRVFGFILALGILSAPLATDAQQAGKSAPGVERFGPFVLGPAGQYRVTVVANYGEPSDKSQDAEKTLTSWGIQDAKGVRLFHEVVDPERHREEFVPRTRCSAVREFQVVPERIEERVVRQDNIITLYRQPDAKAPTERIAVTPALKVRPLQACVGGAPGHVHVGEGRLFLQIRIDGKEGWVREPDFFRLGLEQAG